MWSTLFLSVIVIILASWIAVLFLVRKTPKRNTLTTLIVLGSGGHTGEMFSMLEKLNLDKFSPRTYVYAVTDAETNGGKQKAVYFEEQRNGKNYQFQTIFRSREVGQSYFTSIFSTLWAIMEAFLIIARIQPDLVIPSNPLTF
jgi:beta-1,4-N-acetylglucosaminyltransferase